MNCPHCGATIPDNSDFCTFCGVAISQEFTLPVSSTGHKLQFGKLVLDTFGFYLRYPMVFLVVGLVICGITGIFELFAAMTKDSPLTHVFSILGGLALCYTSVVAIRQSLYTVRGNPGIQGDLLFPPFIMSLRMLGLFLLYLCVVVVIGISLGVLIAAAAIAGGEEAVMVVVGVILIPLGMISLWIIVRFYLNMWYIVDANRGIIDSIVEAWRVSSGNALKLLSSFIVFFTPVLVCAFVCAFVCGYFFEVDIESVNWVIICHVVLIPFIALPWLGGSLAYLQLTGQSHCLEWNIESETV